MKAIEAVNLFENKPNTFNSRFQEFRVEGVPSFIPEFDTKEINYYRPYTIAMSDEGVDTFVELPYATSEDTVLLETTQNLSASCGGAEVITYGSGSDSGTQIVLKNCLLDSADEEAGK